jgi:predicted nucleotidyltransferase
LGVYTGAHNLRVFGSAARGEANENSELDLLRLGSATPIGFERVTQSRSTNSATDIPETRIKERSVPGANSGC